MLELKRVTKKYANASVIDDVSLAVGQNEQVAIMGKSGAGKSTLLHIMSTLDTPSSGNVLINGVDVTSLSFTELAHLRNQSMGFIFQFHHLLPEFTALENVCIPSWIAKENGNTAYKRATDLLEKLGIGKQIIHSKPNTLSGGEQQRVAIARALINNPPLVLADEPTGNLDTNSAKQFMQLINELRKEKQFSFVMATHDEAMANFCPRNIYIEDGKIYDKI